MYTNNKCSSKTDLTLFFQLLVIVTWCGLFFCNPLSVHAQLSFQKSIGEPTREYNGHEVRQTSDGGYITIGQDHFTGSIFLMKMDDAGDTLWTQLYGGSNTDIGYSLEQTSDGGYILAGSTESFGAGSRDIYLIKTDGSGDTLWTKAYGGASSEEDAKSISQTADGGYIIGANTNGFGAGGNDMYLIKTDANGDTLWTKTYGGTAAEYCETAKSTSDGGYIAVGTTYSFDFGGGTGNIYVVKTDGNGDTLWTRIYGTSTDYERGYDIQQTSDDGYIITGDQSAGAGTSVVLLKISSSGNVEWGNGYGDFCSYLQSGYSINQTTDGGYIIAGETGCVPGSTNSFVSVIKTDSVGDTLWTKVYGEDGYNSKGHFIESTIDGGYIITGETSLSSQSRSIYLVKIDAQGYSGYCHESTVGTSVYSIGFQSGSTGTQIGNGATINNTSTLLFNSSPEILSLNIKTFMTGMDVSCNGASDGEATVSLFGGLSMFDYVWSNGSTSTSADNYHTVTGLSGGTHIVTVSDELNCTATDSIVVNEPTLLTVDNILIGDPTCNGGSDGYAELYISGGDSPYSYQWDANANYQVTVAATGLAAGVYETTITDASGCTVTDSATLSEPPAISTSSLITDASCSGFSDGEIDLTVDVGVPTYTYYWSNGATSATPQGLLAGNYYVTVTDGDGCLGYDTATVEEPSPLTIAMTKTDVKCNNGNSGEATATPSGGTPAYTYLWDNSSTTATISGLIAGTYYITVTDNNGCINNDSIEVNQPPQLSASISETDVTCNGACDGEAVANPSGGTPPYTYAWNTSPNQTNQTATGLCPGSYNLNIADANNCQVTPGTTISEPAALNLSFIVTDATCGNADGALEASVSGGILPYNYAWSNTSSDSLATGLTDGTYTLTVTDDNGCVITGTESVGTSAIPPEICLVTVMDSLSGIDTLSLNLLVWEKPVVNSIDYFNIYVELPALGYTFLDTVGYADLSIFPDVSGSDPNTTSFRYKISSVDNCGNESDLSDFHETIHTQVVLDIDDNVVISWDSYIGGTFSYYRILRDSTESGNFEVIDSVTSTNTSYTDNNPPSGNLDYLIEVMFSDKCTATRAIDYNSTRSNSAGISNGGETGLTPLNDQNPVWSVYPNPGNGQYRIRLEGDNQEKVDLKIYDLTGKLLLNERYTVTEEEQLLDISAFVSGMYLLEITSGNYSERIKLIKQ